MALSSVIPGRLRVRLQAGLAAVGRVPALVPILFDDRVRVFLRRLPGAGSLYGDGWQRQHPFDRANHTDTSGSVSLAEMPETKDHPAVGHASLYGGSQPSAVRAALDKLPDI
ncbi:MAG TPA: hypothetical protein VLT58_05250 [Polyangia bacterium]|nr:hypothetical protein [Polyangia bacterium]